MTLPNNNTDIKKSMSMSITKWIALTWKATLAEFVSTLLLLFFGCMSTVPIDTNAANPPLYTPLAFGFIVMFNIQIFGHISGAYMNPFVNIIGVIWGKISVTLAIAYFIAQVAGATLGYGLLMVLMPNDVAGEGLCLTLPTSGLSGLQATFVEILLTMILSLITCAIWDPVNERNSDSVPIKFGLTVAALSITGGPITGASMNPARSIGPVIWSNRWEMHWVYWVGPIVGGTLPALFYKYVWLQKPEKSSN